METVEALAWWLLFVGCGSISIGLLGGGLLCFISNKKEKLDD